MFEKSTKWSVSQIISVPRQGLGPPGVLHETANRLWQSRHWVFRIPGTAACAGLAAFALALLHLILGLAGVAGWSPMVALQISVFSFVPTCTALLLYLHGVSRWELNRAEGLGRICFRGVPFCRCWQFPLRAVSRVVLSTFSGKGNKADRVGLELMDDAGSKLFLPLARLRRGDKAQAMAARLSEWLDVKQTAEPADVPLADVQVQAPDGGEIIVPASPVGSYNWLGLAGASNYGGEKLEYAKDGERLVFKTRLFVRIILVFVGLVGAGCIAGASLSGTPDSIIGWLFLGPLGVLFLLCGTVGQRAMPHFQFDRRRGVVRYHTGWRSMRTREVPLKQVAAVQILYFGMVPAPDVPADAGDRFQAFELNLVLADGRRINMARHAAQDAIRDHGRQITEFLGVPLVNHMDADHRWQ